ncbi:related to lipoyltransferase [Phialocephala subalpina]|uniref:Putative lipoate-protein ligase A n=1 Tax=Phialocephala subalpina TaxID=576137 RepID=A0A1L7XWJ8_9HELO|nr:related to lipoyltransferase [Phialocephala subalpina]
MAPSRGWIHLTQNRVNARRLFGTRSPNFIRAATDPSNKAQVYISRSLDPYLNLSIEHYLLQKTPADSTILFLYTNRPCIVIGRNQNPWVEVNLGLLRYGELKVDLVRRRSGGGTVFHDEGNVNYSVICPTSTFDRDKHAQMVVRALQSLGVEKAKVNQRHDIVVDKVTDGEKKTFKVSGSAYKLTRLRSLHHGTCLLSSPNLPTISSYLRSKAKPFIKARGVESVSSPITNTGIASESFEKAVVSEFSTMYSSEEVTLVGSPEENVPEIAKGLEELKSLDWTYCQTPQFTFSYSTGRDTGTAEGHGFELDFTARHGEITSVDDSEYGKGVSRTALNSTVTSLKGQKIHEIEDWIRLLPQASSPSGTRETHPGVVMNDLFGGNKWD